MNRNFLPTGGQHAAMEMEVSKINVCIFPFDSCAKLQHLSKCLKCNRHENDEDLYSPPLVWTAAPDTDGGQHRFHQKGYRFPWLSVTGEQKELLRGI